MQVGERFAESNSLWCKAFWQDLGMGLLWTCPAIVNGWGWCCCFCLADSLHLKEKLHTGEAYEV